MKKILILAVAATAMTSVFAAPYWMLVNTVGAAGETTTGDFNYYTAYYCTQDQASQLFDGNTTYADITDYLKENWGTFETALADQKLTAYGFDEGEYSWSKYFQTAQAQDTIALVTYSNAGDNKVRVFEGQGTGSGVLFDGEKAGDWSTRAIPEPTSGLLLLLGLAGLALKRKRT